MAFWGFPKFCRSTPASLGRMSGVNLKKTISLLSEYIEAPDVSPYTI